MDQTKEVTDLEFQKLLKRLQQLKQSGSHENSAGDYCHPLHAGKYILDSDFPFGLSNPMFHGRRTANARWTAAVQCNLLDCSCEERQQPAETQDTFDMQHQRCLADMATFRLLSQINAEDEAREALARSNEEASQSLVRQLQLEDQRQLLEDNEHHKTLVKMAIDEFSLITNPTNAEKKYIYILLTNELEKLESNESRTDEEQSDYELYRGKIDSLVN